jgi:hypothetical protein
MGTLQECVTGRYGSAAWELLLDDTAAPMMRKRIGYAVGGSDEIITTMAFDQLKLIMSASCFADSDEECVNVARLILYMADKPDVFPLVSEHKGIDLAARCFVSLSLFRRAMVERSRRRAYPSPRFYRQVGIGALEKIDMASVSSHFDNWAGFVGETLGS